MDLAPIRILIIEDDLRMLEVLRRGLWERGHSIVTATTAQEGQDLATAHEFDAIVLDIGLPDRSGYTIAEQLRQRPDRPAIVMLTALSEEDHVVSGLDSGADDYLTKPFSFPELTARIGSASRRARLSRSGEVHFGEFVLDLKQHRLMREYAEVHVTRNEYLLLRELALHQEDTVSRRQLMRVVWGNTQVAEGSLDTLMGALREKLDVPRTGLIQTMRGSGYCLRRLAAANQQQQERTGRQL
jgi:DNA-binding response OmpR family regulator